MKAHYLACLALLPLMAQAIEPGPSSPQQAETENWLTLQLSGRVASTTPQTASPTERDQAFKRWLDNKHTIPEFFDPDAGGQSGGGAKK
ncbi:MULTISPECIES: DUF3613 domain-containing protein [unclassified Pseudomonas]|uniref:DUF3613 domain-containing protein n=1 Tax=unclassified Pseudomonas TaxID=196821 RepID=UPI000EC52D4C|nr:MULTISPECIES: DUF3613 domain-containing protein [unclassified Pseudomonas]MCS4248033.1 hypothetical protein [Pseudomonas sp. BIGb0164]NWE17693.1 DUF3613 domain-containing protein [Pseudomonas sp. P7548]HCT04935.1 DUF3613 domain-containing protein [Pseudomonas sp.]